MRKATPFDALTAQSSQRLNLETRTRHIAQLGRRIRSGDVLSNEEREFLGSSLLRIANGEDPYRVLCLEVDKPGQRREGMYLASIRKRMAIGWIAAATHKANPKPMSVKNAIADAARHFGYSLGTMKKMWNEGERSLDFDL
jgi:hypothetical protein